jgi:polyphosphate kinase
MQFQKELAKISKEFARMSRRLQKLTASMPKQKSRAQKAKMPKPVAPKRGKKSGIQTVLDMVRKSKKGIDARVLIKKTGFEDKKVRNILFKALTAGKIERVARGVYKISK